MFNEKLLNEFTERAGRRLLMFIVMNILVVVVTNPFACELVRCNAKIDI